MADRSSIEISYETEGNKGRFAARIDGLEGEGELVISKASDVLVVAAHTLVPDSMRGSGVGSALVNALIQDARDKGYKIVPLCPFVRAQADRHPEWADVINY